MRYLICNSCNREVFVVTCKILRIGDFHIVLTDILTFHSMSIFDVQGQAISIIGMDAIRLAVPSPMYVDAPTQAYEAGVLADNIYGFTATDNGPVDIVDNVVDISSMEVMATNVVAKRDFSFLVHVGFLHLHIVSLDVISFQALKLNNLGNNAEEE